MGARLNEEQILQQDEGRYGIATYQVAEDLNVDTHSSTIASAILKGNHNSNLKAAIQLL